MATTSLEVPPAFMLSFSAFYTLISSSCLAFLALASASVASAIAFSLTFGSALLA